LRDGQGVLNIVPLAPVVQELAAEIHLLGRVVGDQPTQVGAEAAPTVVNR
jgi:hypothetical protein